MEPETKNIIPMLSSSPPPMEGPTFDDDDDDGFSNFTSAGFGEVESPLSDMHYSSAGNDGYDFFQTAPPSVDQSTSHNNFADFQTSPDFADFTNANTKSSTGFLPDFDNGTANLQQNRNRSSIDSYDSVKKEKSTCTDESRSASQMSTDPDFSSDRKTFNSDSNSFSSPDTLSLQSPSESVPAVGVKTQDGGPISPDDNLSIDQEDDFDAFKSSKNTPQKEDEDQVDMEHLKAVSDGSVDEVNAGEVAETAKSNDESESVNRDSPNNFASDSVGDFSSGMTLHQDSDEFGSFQSLSDTQGRNDNNLTAKTETSTSDARSASPDVETDLHESGSFHESDNQSTNNANEDDDLNFGNFDEQPSIADTRDFADAGDASDLVFREPMSNDYGFSAFSEPYDFPDNRSRDSDSDKYRESAETSDAKSDSQDDDQCGEISEARTTDVNQSVDLKESSRKESSGEVKSNNDNDNDDFGDFGAFEKPSGNSENDDFGDFGAFEKQSKNASDDFGAFQDMANQGDDDFGEFSDSNRTSGFDAFQQQQDSQSTGDDFGAFSDSKTAKEDDSFSAFQEPKEKGEFGDYSGSDSGFGQFSTPTPSASTTVTQPFGSNKIQRVFAMCFPEVNNSAIAPDLVIELLIDCVGKVKEKKQESGMNVKSNRHKSVKKEEKDLNVWNNLKDVDNTNALTYQWGGSSNDKTMLKSLGIDSRNILMAKKPSSSVPIFAANLTMLQPSKVGEKLEKPDKDEIREESNKDSISQAPLPQVEFDWSSSGLINPLDANSLNLDFFVTETSSNKKTNTKAKSAYDDELLGLEIEPPPMPATKPTSKPFADLLAKMNSATSMVKKRGQRDASLSQEACKILDSLPSLDFMHAKVLMFPMKSSSSNSSLSSA